jgi:hypothetical protein
MVRWLLPLILLVASCAPAGVMTPADRALAPRLELPPMKRFDGTRARPVPLPDNGQLARDFIDLSFRLESGRVLPVFTRFEGPITVGVVGPVPATLEADLSDLLVRLRREAGLDITREVAGRTASITVQALARADLQAVVPEAACFVVPNVSSWAQFLTERRARTTDWGRLTTRSRAAVFLPADVSPQEVRDCLHEEIAQALGPLNDLYRLPFSVFNDDNLHTILTGYDMTILRATYAPELSTGMSAQAVADALPAVLARIHPAGTRAAAPPTSESMGRWDAAIARSLKPRGGEAARVSAAEEAVQLALAAGWRDTRLGYSLLSYGRAALGRSPERAIAAIVESARIFRAAYGIEVHTAHAVVQPAAFALSSGQTDVTLRLTDEAIPAAERGQNAALLATLLLLRAEALAASDRTSEAALVRREAYGWALYGYGDPQEVRRHAAEVAALRPGV